MVPLVADVFEMPGLPWVRKRAGKHQMQPVGAGSETPPPSSVRTGRRGVLPGSDDGRGRSHTGDRRPSCTAPSPGAPRRRSASQASTTIGPRRNCAPSSTSTRPDRGSDRHAPLQPADHPLEILRRPHGSLSATRRLRRAVRAVNHEEGTGGLACRLHSSLGACGRYPQAVGFAIDALPAIEHIAPRCARHWRLAASAANSFNKRKAS